MRVANCSGFFGDRLSSAREMVEGGPIDVLTGDWLAELTMLILARQRMKHGPGSGYARTFLTQMEQVLGTCLDRGIKVVSNAGGLDPAGAAKALREKADELGLAQVRIAYVEGDDLLPRLDDLRAAGETFTNLDTGESLESFGLPPLTANAYLGGRGITAALAAGADVVITGRVADAALVVGPAAWWHGWSYDDDLDALAGAVVAGHVIECGAQATGGNYAFFHEVPGLEHVGFPWAEVAADGSSVIGKHDGTGGLVSVGTVTAQLLYEIGGPAYANPDVTARFDTIAVAQVGPDRVSIGGARGTSAPVRAKVAMNTLGGFRNTASLVLTGLDIEAKADLALRTIAGIPLAQAISSTPQENAAASGFSVREVHVALLRHDRIDPATTAEAQAELRLTVKAADPQAVGKPFTAPIVESALAGYPGMFPTAPPSEGTPYGVYWPTTVDAAAVTQTVHLEGHDPIGPLPSGASRPASFVDYSAVPGTGTDWLTAPTTRLPLGTFLGARSGDKGGSANVGLWVRDSGDEALDVARFGWLVRYLDAARLHALLPETEGLRVDVHLLPNLRAVNVVVHGLLGRGVADSTSLDPQAKGLGEHLRARYADVPVALVPGTPHGEASP
ncbi:MAG TPA: acyclic terpene utilization AtuA family protein [Candidatus Nanopelagicales bacterium]|nr:acyclic terpene utilization AtuA family protein [Candidatus Nanopelagicales bacterium]